MEVGRAVFEAWNAGDMDAIRELFDPDVVVRFEDTGRRGPYVGRDAVIQQWKQQRETFDSHTLEPISEFIDAGDRVVVR